MGFARLTVFLSLLVAGCSDPPYQQPQQNVATNIVWTTYAQRYGVKWKPPAIVWESNCTGPHGELGLMSGGVCVGGAFAGWECDVAWTGNFSTSAFAHELLHAKQASVEIYDPEHTLPEWETLLPAANKALVDQGL